MGRSRYTLAVAQAARNDIIDIRRYTLTNHGKAIAAAYDALIRQAFRDIRDDPLRPGSQARDDIADRVRTYHISLSRERAGSPIKSPRHFIIYLQPSEEEIAIVRVLHDARDLVRHIPATK